MSHAEVAAVVGPTASGKSTIAEAAADRFGATLISVDSVQVYRGMDIGTAKPSLDVQRSTDYRMIDVCDPQDDLSVQAYQSMARSHLNSLLAAGARVIVVGGSGLHFRSLVDPMTFEPTDETLRIELNDANSDDLRKRLLAADPGAGDVVDLKNPRRVVRALEIHHLTGKTPTDRVQTPEYKAIRAYEPLYPFSALGVDSGAQADSRVRSRMSKMLESGLVEEVARIHTQLGTSASQAVGYKELVGALDGSKTLEQATDDVLRATRALVKRQKTFFRRDPRISWMTWQDDDRKRIGVAVETIGEMMSWSS